MMIEPKHTFIIAEAGVNHNGSEELAVRLVEVAAESGADAVKFQTFNSNKLVRLGAHKAEYQKKTTGEGDQYSMLKALEMSHSLHEKLVQVCSQLNIEFMSTAFDADSLDYLVDLGIQRTKVPSGEITNLPFLEHLASKDLPLIISTGMADMQEVSIAIETVAKARSNLSLSRTLTDMVTVLHCTSNYPAAAEDVNLLAMKSIADKTGLRVGYSDHTSGITISLAAAAMGATVIEKHFTLDKDLEGPDHKASLDPVELTALVSGIREIDCALGDGVKAPRPSELPVRDLVRRSVTSACDIAKGSLVSEGDIVLLRPGNGIPPADYRRVLGRRVIRDITAGETLYWSDIETV